MLARYLTAVEAAYLPTNPYHNATHAAHVLHTIHMVLKHSQLLRPDNDLADQLALLAMLLAAATHDLFHPGVTNDFLVSSSCSPPALLLAMLHTIIFVR